MKVKSKKKRRPHTCTVLELTSRIELNNTQCAVCCTSKRDDGSFCRRPLEEDEEEEGDRADLRRTLGPHTQRHARRQVEKEEFPSFKRHSSS